MDNRLKMTVTMMQRVMKISPLLLLVAFAVSVTAAVGPASCVGRCGEPFSRGQLCTCDLSCLTHNECCEDFEATCVSAQSCRGRCAEPFRRGRSCECDPDCARYNTCCQDYVRHCEPSDGGAPALTQGQRTSQALKGVGKAKAKSDQFRGDSNSESEEGMNGRGSCAQPAGAGAGARGSGTPGGIDPLAAWDGANAGRGVGAQSDPGASGGNVDIRLVLSPAAGPAPPGPGQGGDNVDLCSDAPINALTALGNGTLLVFKGEHFWAVDPVSRSAGPPRNIAETLGVPAPVDTVFTRANCEGRTYVIKGDQYWRLDSNMAVEPGFPQPLASGFSGLTGVITAALPVPASRGRPEMIFFFKKGDIMQKFSFPPNSTPSCGKKPKTASQKRRNARKAEVRLGGVINIAVSLKSFPTPITSALSMPDPRRRDQYDHYVFSGPLFFIVTVTGDLPALAQPNAALSSYNLAAGLDPMTSADMATQSAPVARQNQNPIQNPNPNQSPGLPLALNSIRRWLQCP